LIIAMLFGWLEREQRDVIEYLRDENRVLKAQLHGRRLPLNDEERRRLAVIGHRLGRRILADVATIVTPDTILRWHRELIAEVDVPHVAARATRLASRNSPVDGPNGDRQSELGLHAHSGRAQEPGPSSRPIDDRENPQGAPNSTES
jgi:hypothetical protein